MNMRQLRYFLAVAQELNFTRAAERVGIAQPALSQQIIALEQELGTALFVRDNRRVVLSAAGEILIDHAHRVLNAAAAAIDAVHLVERGAHASLSVGAVYSSLYSFLPDVLRSFAVKHPLVELHLQEMTISQQVHALAEGAIEVGLLRGPVHHRELRTKILYHEPLVLASPEVCEWPIRDGMSMHEVAELPIVAVARQTSPSYSDRVFALFERHDLSPRIVHKTLDMHTAVCLVSAGLGVSIVPSGVKLLKSSGIRYTEISEDNAIVSFALAMRKSSGSKLLDHFVTAAEASAQHMIQSHPALFRPAG